MANYTVLILDYEPRGIQQLRDPLQAAGYNVVVVKDGITGMKLFEELKPDLTLIEAMLPKKHGFEVCQELKKTGHGSRSPVVIVTGVYKGRKYRNQALHNYGCDEYLEKPIDPDHLLKITTQLLAGREPSGTAPAPEAPAAPEVAAAPEPAAEETVEHEIVEPGVGPGDAASDAEAEIMERLDEILPGGGGGGTQAFSDVIPFGTGRSRSGPRPLDEPSPSDSDAGGAMHLGRIEGQTLRKPEPQPETRRAERPRTPRAPVARPRPKRRRSSVFWFTMLAVLAAALALLLLMRPF